jgi:hypothetical protein
LRLSPKHFAAIVPLLLAACSVNDSHTAMRAQTTLLGMREVDLETCMGVPDQHNNFGATDILTWYASSTSSTSLSIPLVGGIGESYGGYCHTIVRLEHGVVAEVRYVGETNAFIAPVAYCAPSVRGCVAHPPKPTAATRAWPRTPGLDAFIPRGPIANAA